MEVLQHPLVYAALGDSMSIDDDAGSPDHDFPAWAGRDLTARDPTTRLALLASDGATSTTVAGEQLGRLRRLQRDSDAGHADHGRQRPAGRLRRRHRRRPIVTCGTAA